jgi:hypothetical protein
MAVATIALVGAGLVLLSTTKYGVGLSPDSVDYYDVARSLMSGRGFVFHTGEPLTWYPPLYPMLLALANWATKLDPTAFAQVINAVLFALVICLSARLLRAEYRQLGVYGVLGLCAVLLSAPLCSVYAMAWSECLFIPLVLVYLVSAQRYWSSGGRLSLAGMASSTALACLTRYLGTALVLAGILTILLASRTSLRTRLVRALAFAAISLGPLGFWAVRIYHRTEAAFWNRGPAEKTLLDNSVAGARAALSLYASGTTMKVVALAGFLILTVALFSTRDARQRLASSLKVVINDYAPTAVLLVSYYSILLVVATRDAVIDSRMLSPLYIPATLILLRLGADLLRPTQKSLGTLTAKVPTALLGLWLCLPLQNVVSATAARFRSGAGGYNTVALRQNRTLAYIRQLVSTNHAVRVYSNDPRGLWELARIDASFSPSNSGYAQYRLTPQGPDDLIGQWPPEGEAYLVWFRIDPKWLFSVEELRNVADVSEVAHFTDGSVYHVSVLNR